MRRLLFYTALSIICAWLGMSTCFAQKSNAARKILDRTAKVVGRSGGVSASFTMSNPNTGNVSGTIAVKGNKFNARTAQTTVWFNGKTQWTYMKKNNEVNVSNPKASQLQMMNPYTFINIYKSGYNMSSTNAGANDEVHLVAQSPRRSISEMYITINKKNHVPSQVKMRQGKTWSTINISGFKSKNIPNSTFTFNSKECPGAEVVDLR